MLQVEHFVYMSSAGVYLKSDQMPHREVRTHTHQYPIVLPRRTWRVNEHHRGTYVSCVSGIVCDPWQPDATDPKSRHKGKLDTEAYVTHAHAQPLAELPMPMVARASLAPRPPLPHPTH